MPKTRTEQREGQVKKSRKQRCRKIRVAMRDIENSLLELRKPEPQCQLHHDSAFGSLYYLVALAKKAK